MTEEKIASAIAKARRGADRYAAIMELLPDVDVSSHREFQKMFNGFYRVQRRKPAWYRTYYSIMQQLKGKPVAFNSVLDEILIKTNRVEPSFSSKLVATLNPNKPVWDLYVLQNTGHKAPSYAKEARIALIKAAYDSIERWYKQFLASKDGKLCVSMFDERMPEYSHFTNLKKVDLVLWQTRPSYAPTKNRKTPVKKKT